MTKATWIPRTSVGYIIFNDDISKYPTRNWEYSEDEEIFTNTCYSFSDLPVEAFVDEDNKIESIRCAQECFWGDVNLIGLEYQNFKILYSTPPDNTEDLFVYVNEGRAEQEQVVHDFNDLGLQLWVRNEIIVTVTLYK